MEPIGVMVLFLSEVGSILSKVDSQLTLRELKVGQKAKVVGFQPSLWSHRHKLLVMGLTPGVEFSIQRQAPFGDPIEIFLRGYSLSLRRQESELVLVECLQP
mgnify:CR=1 FL=1